MTDEVEFRWVGSESYRLAVLRALESGGATVESSGERFRPSEDDLPYGSDSSFEPLVVIVSLMSTVGLLRQLEKLWRDFRSEGGWVVDLRNGKVQLHPLPDTPREQLVIVTEEGATTHCCGSGRSARERVQDALTKGAG
jgi:hypothetical protein